jgi:hypothetical protein
MKNNFNMTKKNIYLIFFISFATFLFLIGFFLLPKIISIPSFEIKSVDENGEEPVEIINDSSKKDGLPEVIESDSPLEISIENKTADNCLNIEDEGLRLQCIMLAAERLIDENLCSLLGEGEGFQNCLDKVNYKKAVSQNKINFCLDIKNDNLNQSCVIKILSSAADLKESDCGSLPEREGEYCLDYLTFKKDYGIYQNSEKIEDCEEITSDGVREFCLYKFAE